MKFAQRPFENALWGIGPADGRYWLFCMIGGFLPVHISGAATAAAHFVPNAFLDGILKRTLKGGEAENQLTHCTKEDRRGNIGILLFSRGV